MKGGGKRASFVRELNRMKNTGGERVHAWWDVCSWGLLGVGVGVVESSWWHLEHRYNAWSTCRTLGAPLSAPVERLAHL